MKIVVISDTHISAPAQGLPKKLIEKLKKCDLIIHAGDVTEKFVLDELAKYAEVRAVAGNMDSPPVKRFLAQKLVFTVQNRTIGVTHGKGMPKNILGTVKKMFDKKPDIIIFGHSHAPFNETIQGTLYMNPGSPTDKAFAPYRAFGLITIDGGTVTGKIVRIHD